ncbi:uncharacterized protein N7458_008777 [Penicillium daleae]|uniref:Uncharacterized protein n=1 Tax=Penicillium daleae TaxID=63821 RepID=A0AAD6BVN3_9EURO|nr:uncharacterized protein N7458_008777 [Penicillium daleae]KAJ5437779.1 hypothetical protein N7458_008777 [Penicillium daleae]
MTWCHKGRLEQITKRSFIERWELAVAISATRPARADDDGKEGGPVLTVGAGDKGRIIRELGRWVD